MEYQSGSIFIREMAFEKSGDVVEGHTHNFDHTTYIARGSVKIEKLAVDGSVLQTVVKRAVDGHNWVLIKAEVCHRLTALPPDESAMADKLTTIVMQMREVSREEMQEKLKAALEENASSMGHCVYSHRNPFGEIVEAYDGWMEGYQ